MLEDIETPVILVMNKIDKLSNEQILNTIATYKDIYPFSEIVPVSALEKDKVLLVYSSWGK